MLSCKCNYVRFITFARRYKQDLHGPMWCGVTRKCTSLALTKGGLWADKFSEVIEPPFHRESDSNIGDTKVETQNGYM